MQERRIGDIAVEAIDKIMAHSGFEKDICIGYTVEPDATREEVMQYVWRHEGNGAIHSGHEGHRYRIDRYVNAIEQARRRSQKPIRIQHIDLGCGGGTFTWALLEWCISKGISLSKVRLHSYDYSKKMVKVAKAIHRFIQDEHTQNIPNLHAYSKYRKLLKAIPTEPKAPTHYIITAGYVIANNLDEQMIKDFTEIITTVVGKAGNNPCSLIVYDASQTAELGPAYKKLVASLEDNGVRVKARRTSYRMRIARLRLRGVWR